MLADTQAVTVEYEELCERGRIYQQDLDNGRYAIGELALQVTNTYGKSQLSHFATMINISKSSCYDYRMVSAWLRDNPQCGKFRDEPTLTWSHLKMAARIKDVKEAEKFLNQCADDALTIEQAGLLRAGSGGSKKLLEFTAALVMDGSSLVFEVPFSDTLNTGNTYRIVVFNSQED